MGVDGDNGWHVGLRMSMMIVLDCQIDLQDISRVFEGFRNCYNEWLG